jgi:hypothetical protein
MSRRQSKTEMTDDWDNSSARELVEELLTEFDTNSRVNYRRRRLSRIMLDPTSIRDGQELLCTSTRIKVCIISAYLERSNLSYDGNEISGYVVVQVLDDKFINGIQLQTSPQQPK